MQCKRSSRTLRGICAIFRICLATFRNKGKMLNFLTLFNVIHFADISAHTVCRIRRLLSIGFSEATSSFLWWELILISNPQVQEGVKTDVRSCNTEPYKCNKSSIYYLNNVCYIGMRWLAMGALIEMSAAAIASSARATPDPERQPQPQHTTPPNYPPPLPSTACHRNISVRRALS